MSGAAPLDGAAGAAAVAGAALDGAAGAEAVLVLSPAVAAGAAAPASVEQLEGHLSPGQLGGGPGAHDGIVPAYASEPQ